MRVIALLVAVLATACDLPYAPGADDFASELLRRKGELAVVEERLSGIQEGGDLTYDFDLTSTSGLRVRGRFRIAPDADSTDRRAVAIILGGVSRGGNAIQLIPNGLRPGSAALWYPEELGAEDAADALRRMDRLSDVAWDVPASLMLAADYLSTRPEVDSTRIALIGASFGGFFVPAAAATDTRFRNIALIYAGGDLAGLLAHHLRKEDLPAAAALLGADMAALRLQRLEPVRYMDHLLGRPVLLVNGLNDDVVPRRSAEALIQATRPPRDVVWLPTGHLDPDDEPLLRELVDTAFARLPLLQRR